MKPTIYFLLITLLALALCKISYAQKAEVSFALSPFIGDTLDLAERNYYGLYQDFSGFQRAVYSVSEDESSFLTRIFYSRDGQLIDTLIESNAFFMKNFCARLRSVDEERMDNWEDTREFTLTDINGIKYTGNFLDLEKNRLYMTIAQLNDYSQVINNYRTFNKEDVKSIFIKGGSRNTGKKVGYGFLIGAGIGAVLGLAGGDDKHGFYRLTAAQNALAGGIFFGAIGALIGLIDSFSVSTSDEIITINTDEDFYGLAKFLKN
jgi:hypothetical protein